MGYERKRKRFLCTLVLGEGYIICKMLCSYSDFMETYGDTLGKSIAGKIVFFIPYSIVFVVILVMIMLLAKNLLQGKKVE